MIGVTVMIDVSDRVARELYPISLQQACEEVRRHALVLVVLFALFVGLLAADEWGPVPLAAGMFLAGVVALVLDLRWLWLRHADPMEAYDQLQMREDRERPFKSRLSLVFAVVLIVSSWYLVR
jgi:hypothetical protein